MSRVGARVIWGLLMGTVGCLWSLSGIAQVTPAVPDTLRPAGNATTDSIRVGSSVLTVDSSAIDTLGAQRLTPKQEAVRRRIIPRQATIRSLIFPGLGQLYNRDYWKLPLVYGGLGVSVYFLIFNNQEYLRFERAYRTAYYDTSKGLGKGTVLIYVRSQKAELELTTASLKRATDIYHRYRDLSVIALAAVWALNAVEANVSAHLKTFDLSEDLTLRIQPNLHPTLAGVAVPGARLTLNFKK